MKRILDLLCESLEECADIVKHRAISDPSLQLLLNNIKWTKSATILFVSKVTTLIMYDDLYLAYMLQVEYCTMLHDSAVDIPMQIDAEEQGRKHRAPPAAAQRSARYVKLPLRGN